MARRKEWEDDKCPRCKEPGEDTTHVLRCQSPSATDTWEAAFNTLKEWMEETDSDPVIMNAILSNLRRWRISEPISNRAPNLMITACVEQQNRIGRQALLEGRPAVKWREAQERHYMQNNSRKTGKRWLETLITKIWQVAGKLGFKLGFVGTSEWIRTRTGTRKDGKELRRQVKEEYVRGRAGALQAEKALFQQELKHSCNDQNSTFRIG
jgi:hypothetical protein